MGLRQRDTQRLLQSHRKICGKLRSSNMDTSSQRQKLYGIASRTKRSNENDDWLSQNVTHQYSTRRNTAILPKKAHNNLLAQQCNLGCFREQHPCNNLTNLDRPPRTIRNYLFSTCHDYVAPLIPQEGHISVEQYKDGIKTLHTQAVGRAKSSYKPNIVLGRYPPPIDIAEQELPRTTRTTLAQLRSGGCKQMNNYQNRIDPSTPNICPDCGITPHDVKDLFNCPSNPTPLSVENLWNSPIEVATFLNLPLDEPEDENNMN